MWRTLLLARAGSRARRVHLPVELHRHREQRQHDADALGLQRGDADLVAIARSVLYKPHWGWEAAAALGGQVPASPPYWRSIPRDVQAIFGKIHIGMR